MASEDEEAELDEHLSIAMQKLSMHSQPFRYHGKSSGLVFIRSTLALKSKTSGSRFDLTKDGRYPVSPPHHPSLPPPLHALTECAVGQILRRRQLPHIRSDRLPPSRPTQRARGALLPQYEQPLPTPPRADVQGCRGVRGPPPQWRLRRDGPPGVRDRRAVHARPARAPPRFRPPALRGVGVVRPRRAHAEAVVRPCEAP